MITIMAVAALVLISTAAIAAVPITASQETTGVFSVPPNAGNSCPDGFDLTLNGQECVQPEEVDCSEHNDHPFCTGDMGIDGLMFCDIYADLTGSRNAGGGGCIERND